jgi:hypothetical protein
MNTHEPHRRAVKTVTRSKPWKEVGRFTRYAPGHVALAKRVALSDVVVQTRMSRGRHEARIFEWRPGAPLPPVLDHDVLIYGLRHTLVNDDVLKLAHLLKQSQFVAE